MSEENNLETNFLCAPEDAFEDFQLQAGAACEEEEFITLSDLVPPPPVVPDIPSDLGDIPFDNEIELSTSVEEQLRGENSIEPIPNHDEPASSDSASVAQPVINDATTNSIVEETPVNSGRPKRERKKNIYLESLSSGNRRKKSNGDSNPRPRRGRKQANTQNEVELNGSDVAESLLPYNTPDSTPTPKRGRRKKTDNVISDLEQPVVSKKSPGKRGRRKKAADVLSETLDSNNVLNEFNEEANGQNADSSQEITKVAEKKPGRRGRRSKKEWTELMTTTSMVTVSQENDINTFSVTPNPDNVENALNELFGTNNSDNFDTPKTEDGTSTISKDLTHALEHSEADINESIDNQKTLSDDDEDDVCLSMLSQKKSDHEIDKQPDQSCEPTNIETNGETVKIEMVPNSDDIVVDDCDQELPAQDNIEEKVKLEPIPNTEYNVDNTDSIVKENDGIDQNNSLLVEDCTKRPARRRTKKELHYEEESDEDPFANMELSDDDEPKRRKRRYNSDDEYVPELEESKTKRGKKRAIDSDTDSEELDLEDLEIDNKQKRKRNSRSGEAKSPKKKIKNDSTAATSLNVTTIAPSVHTIEDDDDIEVALQSSVIQAPEDSNIKLGWSHSGTDEFESFLANKGDLKIKKVSSAEIPQNTPLEIPILVPEAKRLAEASTQTSKTSTANTQMQTDTPYDIPMEKNISLTADQSKNACDFLQSIIKTTSELGQLMTQKSEDFLTKKINTKHVDDTFKMDYCVQKSFLLLKLAKSNLFQMEADLSKQYEEFLQKNNLAWCRQEVKKIVPSAKPPDSDSDCEIIEDTASVQKNSEKNKPKFNPKTVFLNKELSIKIAKKPTPAAKPMKTGSKGKLNLKGKQEVWISNSVMVKKVKPTQSFLAQDSRNKKPPDQQYVTEKMVSDFFLNHQRQQALKVCAPFTSPEWVHRSLTLTSVCGYFFVKPYNTHLGSTSNFNQSNTPEDENNEPENLKRLLLNPPSLTSICTKLLQKHMQKKNVDTNGHQSPVDKDDCDKVHTRIMSNPPSLASICTTVVEQHILQEINLITAAHPISVTNENKNPASLFRLCLKTLNKIYQADQTNVKRSLKNDSQDCLAVKSPAELFELSLKVLTNTKQESIKEDHTPDGTLYNDFSENGTFSPGKDEANLDMSEKPDSIDEDHISDDKLSDDLSDNGTFSHGKDETGLDMSDDEHFNLNYLDEVSSHTSYPRCVEIGTEIKNLQNLKTLCFNKIRDMIGVNGPKTIEVSSTDLSESALEQQDKLEQKRIQFSENKQAEQIIKLKNGMKSLFTLCFEQIKDCQNSPRIVEDNKHEIGRFGPQSLKNITLQNIQNLLFEKLAENEPQPQSANCIFEDISFTNSTVKTLSNICFEAVSMLTRASSDIPTGLTINSVNTLSEEAFHNIEDCDEDGEENSPYEDEGDFCNEESYQEEIDENECRSNEDSSWATQVQMQELTSCLLSSIENNEMQRENEIDNVTDDSSLIAQVKLEPVDFTEATQECVDQGTTFIKTESVPPLDEMLNIPDNIVAKQEFPEEPRIAEHLQRQNSFDVNSFEQFVATNKLMHPLDDDDDGIFSQSALRVRRQHDPDYVNEYDPSMGLLIPQTFEPMNIETVKGSLMESSSDDENNLNKSVVKKKPERRGRPKKTKPEIQAKKDTMPNKSTPQVAPVNEVAILTRKMREKIRQEQKKIQSSDSESEDSLPLNVKKGKDKKADSAKSNSHDDSVQEEIQCNDIDSTEQVETQTDKGDSDSLTSFSGFSAVDQNEITSYHKYMKFVYDKIMPKVSETSPKEDSLVENILPNTEEASNSRPESPLINYDDPVEMLECEPTMPDFDETDLQGKQTRRSTAKRNKTQLAKPNSAPESQKDAKAVPEHDAKLDKTKETSTEQQSDATEQEYTERNGWKCYPITGNDIKLCQKPMLILEKLPESFVDTYFQYQNISNIHDEDHEVEKLINLNTISKSASSREGNAKLKVKSKSGIESLITFEGSDVNLATSPTFTDPECNEFSPSEDEGANIDEAPLVATKKDSENNLAKNSLMDDSDSDAPISKIGQGINEDEPILKRKTKSKTTVKLEDPENLTLTADKMMQKELNLLHAPVTMNDDEVPETSKGSHKSKKKYGTRNSSMRDRAKGDDDSSSDEEKQWVNTKEKLLKRLEKKHDTTIMDDAKRTKLVNEFIVRREEGKGHKKHTQRMGKKKIRATKKRLEREKQLRILSHELYGEPIHTAKGSQNLFKGRRNIRKVIDKKSLQRSTVIANMEEFERKRRLALKQAKLRELLGYEESVNVLVINDEVCLEYDLELQEPVVTVHSFFTKVMKAHQYEGVKFMWDACFESLATVASGAPGGGCILAHCMGLGKTLQVLALLHTVLTHPQVNMQRVLVCCPLSTVLNWVDEIHKWITPVTNEIKVFELSKLKKTYERAYQLEDWYTRGGIFIIGYELFRSLTTLDAELDDVRPTIVNKIRTALLDPGPDIIVCDEGHLLKNDCSVLALAMSRVATKRRIVLTGTPMQNNLREYYCMVNFIKPNLLGTYAEYSNRFENPIMNGQHRDSIEEDIKLMKERTHILHKVLEGCLQRQEASVLYPYLPKKHEYTLFISLTPVQWELYKHYVGNYTSQVKHSVLKDFHILQKIWSHPQVLHNFQNKTRDHSKVKAEKLEDDLAHADMSAKEDIKPDDIKMGQDSWWLHYLEGGNMLESLDSSNKFVVVFRILEECIALGDKVLIFSTSLFTMDSMEYFLKKINKWSLGQEYYRLDGCVPAEVRQKWCREFNAENNVKTKLFLISTRAGSLGLNLVAANRVILLDTSWNPAHDIQSIFRVYRFGQKKDCYIYRLVAMGTMEQKIYERSVTKQAVACRVVDEQQIERHYNMAELTELYRFDETGVGVAGGVAAGVRDVALLRVARLPALHAVHEHDSLLRGEAEPQLAEHERAMAWIQFQEEHQHKQMQNHLTSSFALHNTPINAPMKPEQGEPLPDVPAIPESSHLLQYPQVPQPPEEKKETKVYKSKTKKGRPPIKLTIPLSSITPKPERNEDAKSVEDGMVNKISQILTDYNVQNLPTAEINKLIGDVRKMVAIGHVKKSGFNDKLTQTIANVLLGKEPGPQPSTSSTPEIETVAEVDTKPRGRGRPRSAVQSPKIVSPSEGDTVRKRGRPRKDQQVPRPESPKETIVSDLVEPECPGDRMRRKAAIAAQEQLDRTEEGRLSRKTVLQGQIDTEVDTIDLGDADDWQGAASDDDYAPEQDLLVPIPEKPKEKPRPKSKKSKASDSAQTESPGQRELTSDINSILLSDDDEPVQKKNKNDAPVVDTTPVPLHPSLLTNKNFIKIIAHTYLEGNKMLTEDAATLAAQYSALKAQQEFESTGKPIDSGPIYDIAVKVLGTGILKKLHKPNLKKPKIEPQTIKVETPEPVRGRIKAKGIKELTGPAPTVTAQETRAGKAEAVEEKLTRPEERPIRLEERPMLLEERPSRTRRVNQLSFTKLTATGMATSAAGSTETTASPAVVPIGMFARAAGSIPQNAQITTLPKEESILPDDDDVICSDTPEPARPPPVILNSLLAGAQRVVPKIKISGGKIVLANSPTITPNAQPKTMVPATSNQDTICLDSDEEAPPDPPPKPAHKRPVALKSTSKRQAPVPVQLTAANMVNPALTSNSLTLNQGSLNFQAAPGANYVVIPAAQAGNLTRLPPGVVPSAKNIPRLIIGSQNNVFQIQPDMTTAVPASNFQNTQNMTLLNQYQTADNIYQIPTQKAFAQNPNIVYSTAPNVNSPPALAPLSTNANSLLKAPKNTPEATEKTGSKKGSAKKPGPASKTAASQNKTVCKPGDILRITKTGQVEILNRDVEDRIVGGPVSKASSKSSNELQTFVHLSDDDDEAPKAKEASKTKAKPAKRAGRPKKVLSSSSSSSDSSRPATPTDSDPLSILKDVVHIQASDDPVVATPQRKPMDKIIGSTFITKSSNKHTPSKPLNTKDHLRIEKVTPGKESQNKKDKIIEQINKTNTVLKKLNDVLGPASERKKKINSTTINLDSVDLTKSSPSTTKGTTSTSKGSTSTTKGNTIATKGSASTSSSKVLNKFSNSKDIKVAKPTKLVGTSKNIILTGSGKAALLKDAPAKKIHVTSVEKVAPAQPTRLDPKKRTATATSSSIAAAAKKKKIDSTINDLRFFNCDDDDDEEPNIDMNIDIIELE